MKRRFIDLTLVIALITLVFSCQKTSSEDIKGEWVFEKIAHSSDQGLSDVILLSKGTLYIPALHTPTESKPEDRWLMKHTNEYYFNCSPNTDDANSIKLQLQGSTYVTAPNEEVLIAKALQHAFYYELEGNTLSVFFTTTELLGERNILILKRK